MGVQVPHPPRTPPLPLYVLGSCWFELSMIHYPWVMDNFFRSRPALRAGRLLPAGVEGPAFGGESLALRKIAARAHEVEASQWQRGTSVHAPRIRTHYFSLTPPRSNGLTPSPGGIAPGSSRLHHPPLPALPQDLWEDQPSPCRPRARSSRSFRPTS